MKAGFPDPPGLCALFLHHAIACSQTRFVLIQLIFQRILNDEMEKLWQHALNVDRSSRKEQLFVPLVDLRFPVSIVQLHLLLHLPVLPAPE